MEKQKAIEKLQQQVDAIESLKSKARFSPEYKKWRRDTEVAIEHIFGKDTRHLSDFRNINFLVGVIGATDNQCDRGFRKGLASAREVLKSMIDEINEYWQETSGQEIGQLDQKLGSDIFIVHGHDEAIKQTVARFIEKMELKPIILHEQPNKGRTIIEKFEDHTNVGFAVVLMTPDDVGAAVKHKADLKPRARQNVIFELGFFAGKLGRNRVCALYKEGVEIPSDYQGVIFIPMEKDWKLSLAKEIKAAGISIDLNKAI